MKFFFSLVGRSTLLACGLAVITSSAEAQATRDSYTSVNPYNGAVTRTTVTRPNVPAGIGGIIANQNIYGAAYPGTTTRTTVTYGAPYAAYPTCPTPVYAPPVYGYPTYPAYPAYPAYGYPYPAYQQQQTYTYPGAAYSGPISPPRTSWEQPAWITSIPLGGTITTSVQPVQPYPYPYVVPQPSPCAPLYAPGYANPYVSPAYNNNCNEVAVGGTYSTQRSSSGTSVRANGNGVSVSYGQNRSSSTTTITPNYSSDQVVYSENRSSTSR